jgi:HEAT repeat protein
MADSGDNKQKNAVAAMLGLLKDENPDMRLNATKTLAILGGEKALRALAGVLKNEGEPEVRKSAADGLVKLGGDSVTGALQRALVEDADEGVREHIISIFTEMKGKGVENALAQALNNDASAENRRAAAWALAEKEGKPAASALCKALLNDEDIGVRRAAARSLAEFGGSEVVHTLLRAQNDGDELVRERSMESIEKIGEKAIPGLVEVVGTGTNAFHKGEFSEGEVVAAAKALGEIADSSALPKLEQAMRMGNNNVKDAASDAISAIEARAGAVAETSKKREKLTGKA